MTLVEQLAEFVTRASCADLSEAARRELKIRVLDALGVRSARWVTGRCASSGHTPRISTALARVR